MREAWALVTLKDGTQSRGLCGKDSCMASAPTERDLYIQQGRDIDDDNQWPAPGDKSVLIAAGEVSALEFWPCHPQEST